MKYMILQDHKLTTGNRILRNEKSNNHEKSTDEEREDGEDWEDSEKSDDNIVFTVIPIYHAVQIIAAIKSNKN